MRYTKIAMSVPFEGAPCINAPEVFGASPGKDIIFRIPVTGKRPVIYGAENLPSGLGLEEGIIKGKVDVEGEYPVTLTAENSLGRAEKIMNLEIRKGALLLTPLLGFTSWNAFGSDVSQDKMIHTAEKMAELGICEYGYSYINTDSGWQKEYGGEYDAIMPNDKFPDMKEMCARIHSLGLKCGIYSTPMLKAWGCPGEFEFVPGCTRGERDIRFADINSGIGIVRRERENALQWAAWGFDYLKYDWRPTDPYNAELMRAALADTSRDFGFCVSVDALPEYHSYWEKYCNSYRCNKDSNGTWDRLLDIYRSYEGFMDYVCRGHFFDLDMLDVGSCGCEVGEFSLNEDEQLVAYSLRAFMSSPIQISSRLDCISDFELSMYCNDEVIAINQDSACCPARPFLILEKGDKIIHGWRRRLANGDSAIALFNLGETKESVKVYLEGDCDIRDVWAKEDMGRGNHVDITMQSHTARIFRIYPPFSGCI